MLQEVRYLIGKDIQIELKQKFALNGILLYVVSTVFIAYLSFGGLVQLDNEVKSALFWIIMLFASVNAIAKSFVQENTGRQLYYYTIASPQAVILAKTIYNILLSAILSALCYIVFILLLGDFIARLEIFIIALFLGSFGFSSVLTMVAAIASRTQNNFTLMAILSFPIVLPLLLTLMKLTRNAIEDISWDLSINFIIALVVINIMVVVLAYVLFPYLWKD